MWPTSELPICPAGQADVQPGTRDQGVGSLAPQPVPHRGVRLGDGVVPGLLAVTPTIQDNQDRRFLSPSLIITLAGSLPQHARVQAAVNSSAGAILPRPAQPYALPIWGQAARRHIRAGGFGGLVAPTATLYTCGLFERAGRADGFSPPQHD